MKYHDITKVDMKNGDGLRVVLWLSGCDHHCEGCQNPVTWNPDDGLIFDDAAKQEIFEQLEKPYISGITFSGGDPLHSANISEVHELTQEIREKYPDKTIWVYTGDVWEHIIHHMPVAAGTLLFNIDVLVDGEFQIDKKDNSLMWKGSSNQRVIDVQATLKQEDLSAPVLHCGDYASESNAGIPVTCSCDR